jgi:tRNA (guanine37-N1)-methyltransferase
MTFKIITLFPEFVESLKKYSVIGRAIDKKLIRLESINLRDFGIGTHRQVDDKPYGGGIGMLLRVDVMDKAIKSAKSKSSKKTRVILLSPQGKQFDQEKAEELSGLDEIVMICGHYEGFDERIRSLADEEISVGPYVLTGGEIPAMAIIDAVSRLRKGVLGKSQSHEIETFSTLGNEQILEYPQYTRPPAYKGKKAPEILLSGNHKQIKEWQNKHTRKIS